MNRITNQDSCFEKPSSQKLWEMANNRTSLIKWAAVGVLAAATESLVIKEDLFVVAPMWMTVIAIDRVVGTAYSAMQYRRVFEKKDILSGKRIGLLLEAPNVVDLANTVSIGKSLQQAGLHVIRQEVTCSKDINTAIEDLVKKGNAIEVIVIHSHGSDECINLTKGYITEGKDVNALRYIQPGGTVILQSCSTGKDGREGTIAAKIRDTILVPNVQVIAPTEDIYENSGFLDRDLHIGTKEGRIIACFQAAFIRMPIKMLINSSIRYDRTAIYRTSPAGFPQGCMGLLSVIRQVSRPVFLRGMTPPYDFSRIWPRRAIWPVALPHMHREKISQRIHNACIRYKITYDIK